MIGRSDLIRNYIAKNVVANSRDIVKRTMEEFNVSRTTVHRHLNKMIQDGVIVASGTTKQTQYSLVSALEKNFTFELNHAFDEFDFFEKYLADSLKGYLTNEAYSIVEYGVTEMLNNCKDHAKASSAIIHSKIEDAIFTCSISDNGIGVLQSLSNYLKIDNPKEIIFELSKGRLTSDPANHTGEGIFFSSRAFDEFELVANNYKYYRDNKINDWTFERTDKTKGTHIQLKIDIDSNKLLKHLFDSYTDEDFQFTKTDVLIDLAAEYGDRLISRSQAKRVCRNLEKFSVITLDFKKVKAIGQGFVDQLFRIFQNNYPDIKINFINANDDVEFMIKRSLASKK